MSRKILITGGKGGVGKTTVTASLGRMLASRGYKTVLMDGDIGLNNLDVALRAEERILYDVGDIASGKATVNQALLRIENDLYLLPSFTACSALISTEAFSEIATELSRVFDFVLVDCPAGVERSFLRATRCADESIIVTTPHLSAIRDGYKTSKILAGLGYERQFVLVNRMRSNFVEKNKILSAEEIAEAMKLPLLGVIPESNELDINGVLEMNRSIVYQAYFLIVDYLTGKGAKVFDYMKNGKGINGFFRRMKDVL